jgi:hypothetical protein
MSGVEVRANLLLLDLWLDRKPKLPEETKLWQVLELAEGDENKLDRDA